MDSGDETNTAVLWLETGGGACVEYRALPAPLLLAPPCRLNAGHTEVCLLVARIAFGKYFLTNGGEGLIRVVPQSPPPPYVRITWRRFVFPFFRFKCAAIAGGMGTPSFATYSSAVNMPFAYAQSRAQDQAGQNHTN
jgi:hypothetical protein